MIDTDLRQLAEEPPDHALEGLEVEIWAGVAGREEARRITRRLVAIQCLVLAAALIGSLMAGQYWRGAQQRGSLDVFSPRVPLSASTLLVGNAP